MKGLSGKVALVTGAAAGIGKATAAAFAERGVHVVIADLNGAKGRETEAEFLSCGYSVSFIEMDCSCERSISSAFRGVSEKFTALHILVNNAASFVMKGVEASVEDWERALRTNVIGYSLCAKYGSDLMTNGGAIVNVCSISASIAQPQFVTYSASKGAVEAMTRCMALDFATRRIRVNAVSPGTIWTESNESFTLQSMGLDRAGADKHPEMGGLHILKRVGDPIEVGEAIAFLASDSASFITGTTLFVDGGYTAI